MRPLSLSKVTILSAILLGGSMGLQAQTVTFSTPSSAPVSYTVPTGVTAIGVDVIGAAGGTSYSNWGIGGAGARVQGTLAVTPGQVLSIYVGGKGTNGTSSYSSSGTPGGVGGCTGGNAGYYYGAGGGGSSEIRIGSSRLVVAGAGGGGGSIYCNTEHGGDGDYPQGGNGKICNNGSYLGSCYNPTGGSQTAGGVATCNGAVGTQTSGSRGYYYAGGGGGGYWGGGGGYFYAGGGGGSSYTNSSVVSSVTHTAGYNSGTSSLLGNGAVVLCVPNVGSILGNSPVCEGGTFTLTSTASGGVWSSGNPGVATISSAGVVTGVSSGIAVISYAVNIAGCGSGVATVSVVVNPTPAPIGGTAAVCPGNTTNLTNSGTGTWGSSDPTRATIVPGTGVVTGVAAGSAVMTFTLSSTGCYRTKTVTINPLPAPIAGSNNVCASGATTTLSDITIGGTWSSSTPAVATVSGAGLVTGVTAGSSTITYTLPTGCIATSPMLVNPLPGAISGTPVVCQGSTITVTDPTPGGTWSTSNVSQATAGATSGVVTGVSSGTPDVIYTLPTGCSQSMSILVNPLPAAITGTMSMCAGASTTLSCATPGGTWSSVNTAIATVGPGSGVVSGTSAGTSTISYTIGTGCASTASAVVNPLPSVYDVTGGGGYCVGTPGVHVGVNFSNSGTNYKLYNGTSLVSTVGGSNAGLDFGLQTATGTYSVVAVNSSTGCVNNMAGTVSVSINPLPNTFTVTGGGNFCPGGTGVHVNLSGSEASVSYQLYAGTTATGGAVTGTGGVLDFGLQTTAGTYSAVATNNLTGCSMNMTGTATVGLNTAPTVYSMNAGGGFCSGGTGIDVVLSGSEASSTYQLYLGGSPIGSPVAGTGAAIHFGLRTAPGVYTVSATNTTTGCTSNMAGSTSIVVNPLPNVYSVSGGGNYCTGGPGVHVGLNFSNSGTNYQLYRGTTPVGGPVAGSNAGLDLGLQTVAGTYSVVAIDATTGCSRNMTGTATVGINTLPNTFTVTGGGSYCSGASGVHVGLNNSNTGIQYQLFYNSAPAGTPLAGSGSALDFGLRLGAGNYTIVATNGVTSCSANMLGSATITVNPLPLAYTVTGGGTSFCAGGAGIDVFTSGSDVTVSYQLYKGSAPVGSPVFGSGLGIDFGYQTAGGTYTVKGSDLATGCTSTMAGSANVVVNPLPTAYTLTGGGSYCAGGAGVHIGLSGSGTGINYQLFNSSGAVGAPVAGIGSGLDFGLQTGADAYFVVATDGTSGCTNNMSGTSSIFINPLPDMHTVTGGGNYCLGASGASVGLDGSDAGISYQLFNGVTPSGSPVNGDGSAIDFGMRTSPGTYTVVATNTSTTCKSTQAADATIAINPLPAAQSVTGGGTYCSGGAGMNVTLANSNIGITYQLYYMGSGLGSLAGTGSALDFGPQTAAGGYNVIATDDATGCTGNMTGTATVTIEAQPTLQTLTGGGSYCAGGTGVAVGLGGSDAGISYQLYRGTTMVGSAMAGTGSAIDFGLQTTAGSYTVVASPTGVCVTTMTGSSVVTVTPLPNSFTLTGGGSICASSTGVHVGLSGSESTVMYQLYRGTTMVGSPVAGDGSAIDFGAFTTPGTYTTVATDTNTHCTSTSGTSSVTINTLLLPHAYNVTGGGAYCAGGNGVHVTLDGSTTNVNYQLFFGTTAVGTAHAGTGTILDFGLQTSAGNYTIVGTDAATLCTNNMNDVAAVSVDPILTPVVSILAHPSLTIVKQQRDTLTASATNAGTNPTYQWLLNGFPIAGATNSMFISNKFVDHDSLTCLVTSDGACGGVTTGHSVVITVHSATGVQQFAAGSNLTVAPNPNKGIFTIAGDLGTNDDQELSIEVTDLVGHVVYTGKVMAKNGEVNAPVQLSGVANGMYILSVHTDTERKVFHVVIEQ